MENTDPYSAPKSNVGHTNQDEYGEVKMFSFSGRIGRIRYLAYSMGMMLIFSLAFGIIAGISAPLMGGQGGLIAGGLMTIILYGAIFVASFVLAVRRLNDFNASGWLSLLFLVPAVNAIFGLALWIIPGTAGSNNYGLQPPPNNRAVTFLAFLMLFIVVIGIVAAIAIPAYQQYVQQAHMVQTQ